MEFPFFDYSFIALRSVAVYLFLLGAIRISGKKELMQLSIIDLVFIMLISNSLQNAMVGDWNDFKGGMISACSLFSINYLLKIVFYKNKTIAKFIQGEPILLISKGAILENNLKKVLLSLDELTAAAREHGESDLSKIDLAVLETDGSISIISKHYTQHTNRKRKTVKLLPKKTGN